MYISNESNNHFPPKYLIEVA